VPIIDKRLQLGIVERERLEHVRHEAELFLAFFEIRGHLARQLSRRKAKRGNIDVIGMRERFLTCYDLRFLGRIGSLFGDVLR